MEEQVSGLDFLKQCVSGSDFGFLEETFMDRVSCFFIVYIIYYSIWKLDKGKENKNYEICGRKPNMNVSFFLISNYKFVWSNCIKIE